MYGDRPESWTEVDLGTEAVRLGQVALTTSAAMGEVSSSEIPIDDPDGDVGHSSDQIKGIHHFWAYETDAPAGNQFIFYGFTGNRTYESEASLVTGEAVRITLEVNELNAAASFRVITTDEGNRPQESVGDRVAWLIASDFAYFNDNGLVVYPDTLIDAVDYRNQTAANVLDDCAEHVGFNWSLYQDESGGHAAGHSLRFFDPNTSTLDSSDLRISNVLADVDSTVFDGDGATHTWAPVAMPRLIRSPKTLASTVVMPYKDSTVVVTRAATRDIYGPIDVTAADANVKTHASAVRRANRILWENHTEEDAITVSVDLPRANVNDLRAGQRIQVKFRQLPGYKSSFVWCRVLRRTVKQAAMTDEFYTLDLDLSPQEDAQPVVGIVQQVSCNGDSAGGHDLTFPNPVTIGNILVAVIHQAENWTGDVVPPNTDLSDDNWGTGVWTELAGPGRDKTYSDTRFSRGNAIFAKVADSTNQTGHVYKYQDATVYEISGYALTGVVDLTADLETASTNLDVGSLGTPVADALCFLGVSQNTNTIGLMAFSPGLWTTDHEWTNVYFSAPFPCWQGHITADGSTAVEAGVVSSVSYPWGGVAVAIAPL